MDPSERQHRESDDASAHLSVGSPDLPDLPEALDTLRTARLPAEESLAQPIGAEGSGQIESPAEASKQSDSAILQENAAFIAYFMKNFDELQSQGYENNKNQILLGILEALNTIKQYEF